MVSDHAENMGVVARIDAGDKALLATKAGKRTARSFDYDVSLIAALNADTDELLNNFNGATMIAIKADTSAGKGLGGADYGIDMPFRRSVWKEVIDNAERHNDPGRFTTFTGYEWTGTGHRNVIYADGPEVTGQTVAFSALDSMNAEDLWTYLQDYEKRTGGQAFAIPHNGNLICNMFKPTNSANQPLDKMYSQTRSHYEPLYEITQMKGMAKLIRCSRPMMSSPISRFSGGASPRANLMQRSTVQPTKRQNPKFQSTRRQNPSTDMPVRP